MALLQTLTDFLLRLATAAEIKQAKLSAASIKLTDGKLHYFHRGNGSEVLLMLHGAAADHTSWLSFCTKLKTDLTIIVLDALGHGLSDAPLDGDYSIHAQTRRVTEFLAALQIQRVHVLGNSMGGAIALRLAAQQPQLIASLVLLSSAGVEVCPSHVQQMAAKQGKHPMLAVHSVADFVQMLRLSMEKPPYIPHFMLTSLAHKAALRNSINQQIAAGIASDVDQQAILHLVRAPSLIIWGAQDQVLHVDNASYLQQHLPACHVEILPGIGHVPMLEDAQQVARLVEQFYARLPSAETVATTAANPSA